MKTLVIVPTYNEKENISALLPALLALHHPFDILVVDDNSPDGTGAVVKALQARGANDRVHLLERPGKGGLGAAYIAGFKWGLDRGYEVLIEMDADFSHRPHDLLRLLEIIPLYDFAVGSRWVPGGGTINWGWIRKLISRGGSYYSRNILGYPIHDWTGGFNAWKAHVLKAIQLDSIQSTGYSFQIELKYKSLKLGYKMTEVPILFEDRRVGQSKMSMKIVIEAFYRVWLIRSR